MAKILVVEDSAQLGEMLKERLERRGHVILVAEDRETAFACAKAAQPDVILLDSQLRGEEEWETARTLKYDDHTRAIPIIALMENNSEEARSQALQNGAQELHGKPIDFGLLLQQIEAACGTAAPDPEPEAVAG